MSLRSMAVMRADAENRRAETGVDPAAAGEQKKLRDQLIALIPAEAISAFVALIGATAALDVGWRWAVLGLIVVLIPIWVFTNYANSLKDGDPKGKPPWFEIIVGLLAFLAWSTSVPAGPFDEIGLKTEYGAIIVLVAAAILTAAVNAKAAWRKWRPSGG